MRYVVATGWWCTEQKENRRIIYGDDLIRGSEFSGLWKKSIDEFTNPSKIVVVDSASPISNDLLKSDDNVEYITLDENGGHATNITGKYCGWARGVLLSLQYSIFSGYDYYVYVEQDALLYGRDVIEKCISSMTSPYMFGKSVDFPQPLQQSFFIIKCSHADKFVSNYMSINYGDDEISCEVKFALSTSKIFKFIPKFLFSTRYFKNKSIVSRVIRRGQLKIAKALGSFNYLPISGGRDRPIEFSSRHFYFQHGKSEEIERYLSLLRCK